MTGVNDPAADPVRDPGTEPVAQPAPDAAAVAATPADAASNETRSAAAAVAADPPTAGAPPEGAAPERPSDGPPGSVRGQNRLAVLGLGALIVALAFGAGIAVGRATVTGQDAASAPPVAGGPSASADASAAPTPAASGIASLPSDGSRLGRADAKVVVDYWADYQCPFCATFAEEVIPQLESRIADGTVALVHRDFAFLGPESLDAAIAVRCASREGRYWEMHDAVYASQVGENQGAFARDRLAQVAKGVGLDATAFEACMDDREPLVEVLDDTSAGNRVGINSTPTVDVNGRRFGGVSDVPALLAAIDEAAAGASPIPLPTAPPVQDPWAGVTTSGRQAGGAAAPVTVELWMDYQSADVSVVANSLEPELRERIDDGAIRLVQRDLATLGDESVLAAATVRCVANQDGPAWFVHDVLAASGRGAGQGVYTATSILWFAAKLGLDVPALSDCLDDPAVLADVKAETAIGTADGLAVAPAVIIRKGDQEVARFSGELDVAKIVKAIDAAG